MQSREDISSSFCAQDSPGTMVGTNLPHYKEDGTDKRVRIHEYLSFRAAVKTDAGTAAAAHTDESKVRFV